MHHAWFCGTAMYQFQRPLQPMLKDLTIAIQGDNLGVFGTLDAVSQSCTIWVARLSFVLNCLLLLSSEWHGHCYLGRSCCCQYIIVVFVCPVIWFKSSSHIACRMGGWKDGATRWFGNLDMKSWHHGRVVWVHAWVHAMSGVYVIWLMSRIVDGWRRQL